LSAGLFSTIDLLLEGIINLKATRGGGHRWWLLHPSTPP
jgi:hypothetical protein